MNYASIALFVYKRFEHARHTIESLQKNAQAHYSDLIVFSDGPKDASSAADVQRVREYVKTITGFRSVELVSRDRNLGLAASIISGVTQALRVSERVIVVEDDLVLSPFFLQYMNDGLTRYQDDDRVVSLHGYVFPVNLRLPETFFLRGADCWGWATWQRGWQLFNADGASLLQQLERRHLTSEFDFGGAFQYTQMLRDQINGLNDSWAVRWYASAFLADKLTLYPGRSLVQNIGTDGSGTHCGTGNDYQCLISETPVDVAEISVEDSAVARRAFADFGHRAGSTGGGSGILARIRKAFGRR